MKKNYLKPALECIVLNVAWAVCDISADNDNTTGTGGGDSGRNMPRKPF
jgi:hypothetical protein